jgi:hypothetical protein
MEPAQPSAAPSADLLGRVHLFPVRHHSPRSSAALRTFLEQIRPRVILVEGPVDATPLIDVLVDEGTRPPVAILGYRTDGTPDSSLWPFAAYSPEYVALCWGSRHQATVAFIDIPIGQALATHLHGAVEEDGGADDADGEDPALDRGIEEEETTEGLPVPSPLPTPSPLPAASTAPTAAEAGVDIHTACAQARGFRSFEEFWEASFETPSYEPEAFRAALLGYAELVRLSQKQPLHRVRDAFMAQQILSRIGPDLAPEQIVVVVGAAHAAAFIAGDVDLSLTERLPDPVASAATLIPFSFPRLAEQLGYGAGNRAPQYYQRAHDAGCSFRRATLEVLVEFTEHLRLRGFMASLADTIEAYRLAVALAAHRGKAEPGLDELREATIATMCRGDATHVDGFLWPSVIGRNVGRVADRIGKNSLQAEFWREVEERRLPRSDAVEAFVLKLNDPLQVQTSVFLHRLRIAGVPYASYTGKHVGQSRRGARAAKSPPAEEVGQWDALTRVSEAWEAQWTPSTDVALVEKIVLGDTLEQVATRVLADRLSAAHTTGEAADVLLEAVVTGSGQTVSLALTACDRFASDDDDLHSLARAASVLSNLVSFGSSRARADQGDKAISALCDKTFERAVLRVEDACTGNEEAVQKPKEALRILHSVALAQPLVDRAAWFTAARAVASSYAVNPSAAGLAAGLLYLAQEIRDEDVSRIVGQRLGSTLDPAGAAGFLQGFFEVNALALVKSRPVVTALDAFLTGIDADRFRDALPVLRRAFSPLGPTERRYLLENVLGAHRLGEQAKAAQAILLEKDKEKLKAMSADLSQAMDDLDDLL